MKRRFWDSLMPRKRKLVLWVLGVVLFYAILGFFILPPIVRHVAVKQLSQQLGREVSIEKVKINPFVLSASIHGLLVKDKDREPFISWDELYVNLQLLSFFEHPWVFKEISLSKPYVRVQMNKDRTFNFSDIIDKFSTNAPAKKAPSKPIGLHVGRLHIGGAKLAMVDLTPREPFKRLAGPLDLELFNFRTDPDSKSPYSFNGTTEAGETISWNGSFSLTPLWSEGEVKMLKFTINKYAPLYQDLVRFQVRGGSIGLKTKYRFEFSATNRVTAVEDLAFELRDFKLGEPGQSNNIIDVPLFSITGANVDLQKRDATVNWLQLTDAKAFLNRSSNAMVNVVELSKPAESATNAPGGVLFVMRALTNAVAELLNSTNEWTGTVRNLAATNCEIHLKDFATSRPAKLDLTSIRLQAKNLSNLAGTNFDADFSLRWNTNGAIHIGADVGFQPTIADVKVDFDHLNFPTLDAYLADKVDVYILGSDLNLHGALRLRPKVNDLPVISFNGDASLDNFHTVDGVFGEDLLKWDALRFNHIAANLNPPQVSLHEIVLDNAYARIIVETNRTINLVNILKPGNAAAPATNAATSETKKAVVKKKETSKKTEIASQTKATNMPVQVSIGAIVITNTAINFSDLSVKPNVHMALESVNGSLTDLSTEKLQHARINLSAKVNGAGLMAITGDINPLNGGQTNDIKITLKDVDLTPTSLYAGRFAGYGIAEGKLNVDLTYHLVGKMLSASNYVMLDQFTFGEKVSSPEATHLPVRLAVAIMKDRDGKIILDVPVQGSVDDPEIRKGKVIRRAILNILEKVATSPFSLLGALIGGGGEELGWQDFALGSAKLTPDGQKKLDQLAKGLYARPALKLEIAGSVDPEGDHEGLQRAALDQEIRQRIWMKLHKAEQATNSADQLVLSPDGRAHNIDKMYAEALEAHKITPEMIAANTNLAIYAAEAGTRAPSVDQKGAELLVTHRSAAVAPQQPAAKPGTKLVPPPNPPEALLMATIPVSDADLATLAASRAKAVQTYLVETANVDAGRIFLTASGTDNLRRDGSRAYLEFR